MTTKTTVYAPDGTILSETEATPAPLYITRQQLFERLTTAEIVAINKSQTDSVITIRTQLYTWDGMINLYSPVLAAALSQLVAVRLLTNARKAEILTP